MRWELDGAARKTNQGVILTELDDAETCVFGTAINAQHAHGMSLYEFSCQWLVVSCQ